MEWSLLADYGGWIVAILALAYSIYRDRVADKRLAEATNGQKAAEAQLAEIQSRGQGPYLCPSMGLYGHIYEQEGDKMFAWQTSGTNVLWSHRQRVSDLKDGDPVIFLLENNGKPARRIRLQTALKNCVLKQEPDFDSSHGVLFLRYEYESSQLGKPCQIALSFESYDGFQDTHIYETIHGEFHLVRTKPA